MGWSDKEVALNVESPDIQAKLFLRLIKQELERSSEEAHKLGNVLMPGVDVLGKLAELYSDSLDRITDLVLRSEAM